ncbi:hybrid sensor histidine kinase/response regulator [Enterobacter cloacae]|uniref:hybrid sensor histidine kinase/response regulator n=1 Tax=Enterobacter cloacae TaxID=550 RepID=UPI000B062A25|nr:ATP-binding protein [Enterobacter cloacae]
MISLQKAGILKQLRRHHYLMINGGGILITLCVLLAGGLEVWALLRDHQTRVQQEMSAEVSHMSDLRTRTIATLRNGIQNIELFMNAMPQEHPGLLQTFRNSNGSSIIQASPEAQPIVVLATQPSAVQGDAWPAIALAQNISPMAAKIRDRNAGELSAFIYSSDGEYILVAVAPFTPEIHNRLLTQQYKNIVANMNRNIEPTLAAGQELVRPDKPLLHWFPASESLLTHQPVFRIATKLWRSDIQRFGTLVFELPVKEIEALLPTISAGGECLILNRQGQLVLPCDNRSTQNLLPLIRNIDKANTAEKRWVNYQSGHIIRGWQLNSGDWTFIYAQSWREVLKDNRQALIVTLLSSCLIIFMTWFFLLMVKRRVLAPAIRQSEAVFESEQLSRTLIDTAPVGLGLIGLSNGKPLLQSPVMKQMQTRLQLRNYNLPAELIRSFLHQNDASYGNPYTGPVNDDLTFGDRDDTSISLSVSASPVRYRNEDALVVAFVDVTNQKLLEKRLLTAKEEADRASAAKSSFLATMSHEIRTPLNAILGNLELLEYSALDSQRDRLTIIRHASDNLLATISDILDFSKIEAGEMHVERIEFDLAEIVTRSLAIFAPVAQAKGITLVGEPGSTVTLPVTGDPTCLQQVINNLLSNALKFTERGQVILRLRVENAAGELHIETEDTGIGMTASQQAKIFNPFSQADETINRRYGGTGLGLALCMRLVHSMGGVISVTSEPNKGSLFRITFPLSSCTGQAERPRFDGKAVTLICADPRHRAWLTQVMQSWGLNVDAYQHPALPDAAVLSRLSTLILWGDRSTWHPDDENRLIEEASYVIDCLFSGPQTPLKTGRLLSTSVYGLKGLAQALGHVMEGTHLSPGEVTWSGFSRALQILIAEDNPVNARLFQEQLQLLGCHATLVSEGEEALQQLRQKRFDILLTDLSMPGMDGYTLARRARIGWPDLPIMAVTANATEQEYQDCEAAGMTRVLTKPLLLSELKEALMGVLGPLSEGASLSTDVDKKPLFIPPHTAPAPGLLGGHALPDDVRIIFERTCAGSLKIIEEARLREDATPILAELHSLSGAFGVFEMQSMVVRVNNVSHQIKTGGLGAAEASLDALCAALWNIAEGNRVETETLNATPEADALLDQLMTLATSVSDPDIRDRLTTLQHQLKTILSSSHHF